MSIYVGNLADEIKQEHLSEVFNEYGNVQRVYVPKDRETGLARGFAFVEMKSEANESKAIAALNGAEWMDRDIKVDRAKPRNQERTSFAGYRYNSF